MSKALTEKVLVIGWDAADWKVIMPLVEAGKMPHLKKFLDHGATGNLSTLYPILSPMLWTSIATGKRAYKHGVHGFAEPDASNGGARPITNLARQTKAIWNILNQEGKRSNVLGWWPSHPVEPINGVMVCNHFQEAPPNLPVDKPWPIRPGSIHPPKLTKNLAEFRVRPSELEGEQLLPFVPKALEIDQEKDRRLYSIAKILAETATVHGIATTVMQNEPWDFMGVYFDAIDHFGHGFMKYHPPRSPWISEADFELYNNVVNTGYQFHDLMLGATMELAGPETTIIICSDHGFHPDRLRPQHIPNAPAGPAEEHRPFGMVAMHGPGIKQGEQIYGATLLDITPTILTLFGLPVGCDMDGKALITAFDQPVTVNFIDSWDQVEGNDAMHPPDVRVDAIDSQEAMQQLVELGYIDELNENQEQRAKETARELKYNLACSYMGASRNQDAIPILQELWEEWPTESRFGVNLFQAYLATEQIEAARTTLETLVQRKKDYAKEAAAELKQLAEENKDKKPEDFSENEWRKMRKLRARASTNLASFAFMRGSLLQAEKRYDEALQVLQKAQGVQTHNLPSLFQRMGEIHLAKKDYLQAESHFLQVLELDPVNPTAQLGLCRTFIRDRRYPEALDRAFETLALAYHNPKAHFYLGIALNGSNRPMEAIQALESAILQNPIFPAAHRWLGRLYANVDLEKASLHRRLARETRQQLRQFTAGNIATQETPALTMDWYERSRAERRNDFTELTQPRSEIVTVVSGLPRSGTSMMMQMLVAGGIEAVTDEARQADESNPRGYFELEKVKQLSKDKSWLKDAQGQVVKVVAQLLPQLPPGQTYRIIFMERHLQEVIASQTKMLQRLKKKGAQLPEERLAKTYLRQLETVDRVLNLRKDMSVLYLNYEQVVNDPQSAAIALNQFLGGALDVSEMISSVSPELRNQKIA